ncbi:RNA-binding protein [Bacillus sp. RG28]|uniref:RNA-binding protein n=1 Tax=Gottfriedia endophytica TaxID=2820819 RepID=A0A940NMD8_9BACI|nr:RNA-binding protein [Gottfriedia endophytica]MBP0724829.1 RNA-binding protein [Gottfriedia endophytica]
MSIYDHFRKEERVFVDQILKWKEEASERYSVKLTDFLDEREQFILQNIIGHQDEVKVKFFGGTESAERKRAIIYREFMEPNEEDFELSYYEIHYESKFHSLSHRDVLGSMMSLGMKRTKFGDILNNEDRIQIILMKEIESFVEINFNSIRNAPIKLEKINSFQLMEIKDNWTQLSGTVSSLRIDSLISEFYNLSRQKAQMLVKAGLVKVNQKIIDSTSFQCAEGDVFSVRGFGRSKLLSIDGKSKKEKWRIIYGTQK